MKTRDEIMVLFNEALKARDAYHDEKNPCIRLSLAVKAEQSERDFAAGLSEVFGWINRVTNSLNRIQEYEDAERVAMQFRRKDIREQEKVIAAELKAFTSKQHVHPLAFGPGVSYEPRNSWNGTDLIGNEPMGGEFE